MVYFISQYLPTHPRVMLDYVWSSLDYYHIILFTCLVLFSNHFIQGLDINNFR